MEPWDTIWSSLAAARKIPLSTYRVQVNAHFPLPQVVEQVDYLNSLGVETVYCSPLFQSCPGSTHGYDVACFGSVNESTGGEGALAQLADSLHRHKMQLLLDIVPNHMGAHSNNAWWRDVLQKGPSSKWAEFFDIRWEAISKDPPKVLLPVLEDHYAKVLEAGKIRVAWKETAFVLKYYDAEFPLSEKSHLLILEQILRAMTNQAPWKKRMSEFQQLYQELDHGEAELDWWDRLGSLVKSMPQAVESALIALNGRPGFPHTFDLLDQLLQKQFYLLAYWKRGTRDLNYRRFFDVTALAGIKMERPEVFQKVHETVLQWVEKGWVQGLRIDHPDGLRDPEKYLYQLQEDYAWRLAQRLSGSSLPDRSQFSSAFAQGLAASAERMNGYPLYVVVEKILSGTEPLPAWPVAGTTGYDFLNQLNGLFIHPDGVKPLQALFQKITHSQETIGDLLYRSKKEILESLLQSEVRQVTHQFHALAQLHRHSRDLDSTEIKQALVALMAAFPVYRTYLTDRSSEASKLEIKSIQQALQLARQKEPQLDPELWKFLENTLMLCPAIAQNETPRSLCLEAIMRFQQLTGPAMAKGLEDTTFYRDFTLLSRNEVGAEPGSVGTTLDTFHDYQQQQARRWPHSLIATATHDTKRGEDARARINVLSEMPARWNQKAKAWIHLYGQSHRLSSLPERAVYFFLQALAGSYPYGKKETDEFPQRMKDYLVKAAREGKEISHWWSPDARMEKALQEMVDYFWTHRHFRREFATFHAELDWFGQINSLSQVAIKLTSPGVPDIYQGTELWDFSFVDPDNRRPVDYAFRRALLQKLSQLPTTPALFAGLFPSTQGEIKLLLIKSLLHYRRLHPSLFQDGQYERISVKGPAARHVIAFGRRLEQQHLIVLATRWAYTLLKGKKNLPIGATWGRTVFDLPGEEGVYSNVLTGEKLKVGKSNKLSAFLKTFPIAILIRETARETNP